MKKLILAAALAASLPAHAGDFSTQPANDGKPMLIFSGDIDEGDARRLSVILEQHIAKNTPIRTLFLNSPGGLIKEGVMMSNMVRNYGLSTIVMDGEQCASACFVVFAAGEKRLAGNAARIGVHQAYNSNGSESAEATRTMVRMSTQLGVSPTIIQRMKITAPKDVAWLTKDELQESGVQVATPESKSGGQTTPSSQPKTNSTASLQQGKFTPQKNMEWKNFVGWAGRASVQQSSNGKPIMSDKCYETHCALILGYTDKSNRAVIVIERSDVATKDLTARIICRAAEWQATTRSCTDFDTGETWNENHINNEWVSN